MLPQSLDQYLYRTWQIFNANFGSLRLFGEQIAQVADRLDRQSVSDTAEVLADVFDEPQEQVETNLTYGTLFDPVKSKPWFKNLFDVSEHDQVPRRRK